MTAPAQLRAWLDREGRKVRWLSEQVGCHRNNISRALSGVSVPTASTRKALADLTGLDIAGKEAWE